MSDIGVFTIASKNYLAHVRVLLKSVARMHPEYRLFLCLVDQVDGCFDPGAEPYTVLPVEELEIPTLGDMAIRYDIMELNTAVKPYVFQWLLKHTDVRSIIYLDPDIRAYSRFSSLEALLRDDASVVLIPHITKPLEDDRNPNDHHMLQSGVFNLGFMALNRCDEADGFLAWWGRRLKTQACSDVKSNLFTDQRWCDLAPCFLEHLKILRDPGYNVAYWNLGERRVEQTASGSWAVNDSPLAFFHFSGYDIDRPTNLSKHQNRFEWDQIRSCHGLFEGYARALTDEGISVARRWPYAFEFSAEGFSIPKIVRLLYREVHPEPEPATFADLCRRLPAMCAEPAPDLPQDQDARITRLMATIYWLRPDVQAAFDLRTGDGRKQFSQWFAAASVREYGLGSLLRRLEETAVAAPASAAEGPLADQDTADATVQAVASSPAGANGPGAHRNTARRLPPGYRELHEIWRNATPAVKRDALGTFRWSLARSLAEELRRARDGWVGRALKRLPVTSVSYLEARAPCAQLLGSAYITNLMYEMWKARRDIRDAFDLKSRESQEGFVSWFCSAVGREYGYSRAADTAGANGSDYDAGANGSDYDAGDGCVRGANLIGYANAQMGMGEHVRMTAAALSRISARYGVVNIEEPAPEGGNGLDDRRRGGNRHAANIFHVNADQMIVTYCQLGRRFFEHRYNIGYWAWELARCPEEWAGAVQMVDEIWAPSRFIQDAFAERAKVPVEYMPLCVSLPDGKLRDRSFFDLPSDAFVFLYTFDFASYIDRKNPVAAVHAFKRAFRSRTQKVALAIKVMNGREEDPSWQKFREAIGGDRRIRLINRRMSRHEVVSLIGACDCFVSLHRSEGFGRGPAEAMYLGKPVIATNYSGNTDFTLPDNSCPVDFRLVPVGEGQYPFSAGQVWADPDADHAAWYMRKLVRDRKFWARIGRRGRQYIHENFNEKVIGERYLRRLVQLGLA